MSSTADTKAKVDESPAAPAGVPAQHQATTSGIYKQREWLNRTAPKPSTAQQETPTDTVDGAPIKEAASAVSIETPKRKHQKGAKTDKKPEQAPIVVDIDDSDDEEKTPQKSPPASAPVQESPLEAILSDSDATATSDFEILYDEIRSLKRSHEVMLGMVKKLATQNDLRVTTTALDNIRFDLGTQNEREKRDLATYLGANRKDRKEMQSARDALQKYEADFAPAHERIQVVEETVHAVKNMVTNMVPSIQRLDAYVSGLCSKTVNEEFPLESNIQAPQAKRSKSSCAFCDGNHLTILCTAYASYEDRSARGEELGLCRKCILPTSTHINDKCPQEHIKCARCGRRFQDHKQSNHHSSFCSMVANKRKPKGAGHNNSNPLRGMFNQPPKGAQSY